MNASEHWAHPCGQAHTHQWVGYAQQRHCVRDIRLVDDSFHTRAQELDRLQVCQLRYGRER